MVYLRRKFSLRFFVLISIVVILSLFFLTMVQFNQIETNNEGKLRAKVSHEKEKNADYDRLTRIKNLNARVAYKFQSRLRKARLGEENEYEESAIQNVEDVSLIKKTLSSMQRVVHLDLKGAPPKLAYLRELIPFLKKSGATGVLIEYEDFFPYSNDLEAVANQNHYTNQELNQIFALLKESQLSVIPLVQTYGHLEFVLKLKQYAYLREAKQHFQVITPCHNDTYDKVIFRMLDQIIDSHPEYIEYIHIGCDEVYHINVNPACKSMSGLNTEQDFFIHHVAKVVSYIKKKRPNLNVLIWDDMIRKNMHKNDQLKDFAKTIIPMVWDYNSVNKITKKVWKNYDQLFDEIWVASAFKGATQNLELIPNAAKHYANHLSWLNVISSFQNPQKFKGIALTGWTRYDHMQAICEILPAGVPSLALSLQTLVNYDQDESDIFSKVKDLTKCSYAKSPTGFVWDANNVLSDSTLTRNISNFQNLYECDFPGFKIYKWLLNLKLLLGYFDHRHLTYSNILNKFNLKNNYFNTMIFEKAVNDVYPNVKRHLKQMQASGEIEFDKYFYGDLYEEITNVYITRTVDLIEDRLAELNKTKLPDSAPVRPFEKIAQSLI